MADLEALAAEVYIECDEVPPPLLEGTTLRIARHLCHEGRVWRTRITFNATADQNSQDASAEVPASSVITELREVIWNQNTPLDLVGPVNIDYQSFTNTAGSPKFALLGETDNEILLYPQPTSADEIWAQVALQPSLTATTIPDFILNQYYETMLAGIIGTLMRMPNKPWTAAAAGDRYLASFAAAVDQAAERASDGVRKGSQKRVKYGGY